MDKNKRSRMRKGGMGKESIQKEVDKQRTGKGRKKGLRNNLERENWGKRA